MRIRKLLLVGGASAAVALASVAAAVAGAQAIRGTVADGSSTVGPLTTAAAEAYREEQPGVNVEVGISGTGGGFERFCRGETDLSNASRPIKDEEATICKNAGIDYVEFQVANDGSRSSSTRTTTGRPASRRRAAEEDLGAGLEGDQLERGPLRLPRTSRSSSSAPAPTRAPSTTSPTRSTARRARAAPTTTRARTTTSPSRASPASGAGSATSASRTSRRTRTR